MSNFTPGPWMVSAAAGGWHCVRANNHQGPIICGPGGLNSEANWYLISAAPDLYAVCAEIRESFSYFSEWDLPIGFEDRLNAALKKAGCKGCGMESRGRCRKCGGATPGRMRCVNCAPYFDGDRFVTPPEGTDISLALFYCAKCDEEYTAMVDAETTCPFCNSEVERIWATNPDKGDNK